MDINFLPTEIQYKIYDYLDDESLSKLKCNSICRYIINNRLKNILLGSKCTNVDDYLLNFMYDIKLYNENDVMRSIILDEVLNSKMYVDDYYRVIFKKCVDVNYQLIVKHTLDKLKVFNSDDYYLFLFMLNKKYLSCVYDAIISKVNFNYIYEDSDYNNFIMMTIKQQNNYILKQVYLLNIDFDINYQNSKGQTLLHMLIEQNNLYMAQNYINTYKYKLNYNLMDECGYTILHLIILNRLSSYFFKFILDIPYIDLNLNLEDRHGYTILMHSVFTDNVDTAKILYHDKRCNINYVNKNNMTIFNFISEYKYLYFQKLFLHEFNKI